MRPDLHSKRLIAAMMASCLLHGTVVVMPYFGASTAVSRLAGRAEQAPGPARVLKVRLVVLENASEIPVAGKPAAVAGAAELQAPRQASAEPRAESKRALGAGVLPVPAPAYYSGAQLTKRPRPIGEPDLGTPVSGRSFPSGLVILRLWIDERGVVVSADVETTDLPDALAARAAEAFAKVRFEPGEIAGRRVPAVVRIEVTYNDPAPQRP